MSSLFFLLSFIVVNGAVIKLRRERPDMTRPYEMPLYPLPPLLGIVLNLVLTGVLIEFLIRTDPLALVLSASWIVLGVVTYVGLDRFKTARGVGVGTGEVGEPDEPGTTDVDATFEGGQGSAGTDAEPAADEDD
jgi:amino acid transporter